MRTCFLVSCILFCVACAQPPGNPGPAGPIVNANPRIVDGETMTTIPASLTEQSGTVVIAANGYLERHTRYRNEPTLSLWPLRYGADEAYVRQLVYNEYVPESFLTRVVANVVILVAGNGIAGDTIALEVLDRAATTMTALTRGEVQFAIGTPILGAGMVIVEMDPNDPYIRQGYAGLTYNEFDGSVITSSRVVLADPRNYGFLLHELGHVFGLGHSPRIGDRMYYRGSQGGPEFSFAEQLQVTMMLQRTPGTAYPDDDTAVMALSRTPTTIRIICR